MIQALRRLFGIKPTDDRDKVTKRNAQYPLTPEECVEHPIEETSTYFVQPLSMHKFVLMRRYDLNGVCSGSKAEIERYIVKHKLNSVQWQ